MEEYNIIDLSEEERKQVYNKIAIETMVQKKAWDLSSSIDEAIEVYLELKNKINNSADSDNKIPDNNSLEQKNIVNNLYRK